MAISTLTIPCPIDGLACFSVALDWKRNIQRDRDRHVHIEVRAQAQCANGHRWRISENGGTEPQMLTLYRGPNA